MATASTSAVPVRRPSRGLGAFAWAVVGYNILVILWGAVVRATGSGAGCGDRWPLCNGDFFPHHPRLATVIEFAHRSMSGVCTVLVVALAVWTFRVTVKGDRTRRAAMASVFFLVTEALLGAVLVLGGYVEHNISTARVIMQSIHFTNTMMLLAVLGLTAWWLTNRERPRSGIPSGTALKGPAWTAAAATLVVGATGAVAALADTLFPSPSLQAALAADFAASAPLLVRMRWIHPAAAAISVCCVVWLVMRVRSTLSRTVAGLLVLQLLLGVLDVFLLAPTWMQILHLLVGDLYWIVLVALVGDLVWPTSSMNQTQNAYR
jgi:cytochrome c oxidase assembly protein subunit 15